MADSESLLFEFGIADRIILPLIVDFDYWFLGRRVLQQNAPAVSAHEHLEIDFQRVRMTVYEAVPLDTLANTQDRNFHYIGIARELGKCLDR